MYFDEPATAASRRRDRPRRGRADRDRGAVRLAARLSRDPAARPGDADGRQVAVLSATSLSRTRPIARSIRTVAETASTNDDVAALAARARPEGRVAARRPPDARGAAGRGGAGCRRRAISTRARWCGCARAIRPRRRWRWSRRWRCRSRSRPSAPARAASNGPTICWSAAPSSPASCSSAHGDAVVVGFGVNLAHHPDDLDRPATSLAAATGIAPDPDIFLAVLADSFARWLASLARRGPRRRSAPRWLDRARIRVRHRALDRAPARRRADDRTACSTASTTIGALRLRLADGRVRVIHAGDVFLIAGLSAMLLAIDAGNTNVVFALVAQREDGPRIRARWRIATDPRRTADEYAVWLHQLLATGGDRARRRRRGRSSPPSCRARCTISRCSPTKYFGVTPLIAGQARRSTGASQLDVTEPHTRRRRPRRSTRSPRTRCHGGDLIVIDFGTATTFDVDRLFAAPTRAGSSRRASTCRSTRWSPPPPSCRASRSRRPNRQRDRTQHRRPDADRHLLGLCRDDRRAGRADARGNRPAGQGDRHRRALPRCSTSIHRCSTRSNPISPSRAWR